MKGIGLERFVIDISDDRLDDLTRRLKNTRWDADPNNEDHFYGVSSKYLKNLVNGDTFWNLGTVVPEHLPHERKQEALDFYKPYSSHISAHMLDGQTLTHGPQ